MRDSSPFFRCQKLWQTAEPVLVLQLSLPRLPELQNLKKAYLLLDARQESFGVTLSTEKPQLNYATGAFANLFRKHLASAALRRVLYQKKSGDYWFEFFGGGEGKPWWIKLAKSRPPELVFITPEKEVLVRFGQKGTFTKRRPYEGERVDDLSCTDETMALMATLRADNEEEEAEDDGELLPPEQRELVRKARRKLKTLKKAEVKARENIPTDAAVAEVKKQAEALKTFAHLAKDEAFELRLSPEQTGHSSELLIPLEPEWSIGKNMNAYFAKVKKLEKSLDLGRKQHEQIKSSIAQTEDLIGRLTASPLSPGEIADAAALLGVREERGPRQKSDVGVAKPFKVYASSLGHRMLVGKGAKDNDELTKAARAQDYWLHAVGVTGSHVIVPAVKEIKDQLPEATRKEAAILALQHSKLKGDLAGEVYFTRRAHIRKKKGLPDGLWLIDRSETLFIRYTTEELKAVLGRQSP